MPTVLRVDGHRFFFFSNEGLEPAHIHVEKAGCIAKFWLDDVALVDAHGYTSKELRRIRELVVEHRQELLDAWDEHFSR